VYVLLEYLITINFAYKWMGLTDPDKFIYLNTFMMKLTQRCLDNWGPTLNLRNFFRTKFSRDDRHWFRLHIKILRIKTNMRNGLCQTEFFLLNVMRILIFYIFCIYTHTYTLIVPKKMFITWMQRTQNSQVGLSLFCLFSTYFSFQQFLTYFAQYFFIILVI